MANTVSILGNNIANLTMVEAITCLEEAIQAKQGQKLYIVNAHTLNLSAENATYAAILRRADLVFGDGSGVRLAAMARGVRMKANLVGTDLIPAFLTATGGRGYRCYLLGADDASIERAAQYFRRTFPGWTLAGYHHGHTAAELVGPLLAEIEQAHAHVLLVGMGNPLQETWIDQHAAAAKATLCIGVGGMFDHWAGNLRRAPWWVRRLGCEWLQLLLQQPHKARRYLLGNPLFIWRILRSAPKDRRLSVPAAAGDSS